MDIDERESTYNGNLPEGGGPGTVTRADGTKLPLRTDISNRSPTGFAWGYRGSGPRQLAIALLADVYDDDAAADPVLQLAVKDELVAYLPNQFEIEASDVRDVVEEARNE